MRKQSAGFTLLEVLVAMAIAALVFITMQRSQGHMIQVIDRSRMGVLANLVATNHMEELRSIKWWPSDQDSAEIEENLDLGGFEWVVTRRYAETLVKHMMRIEIDVALATEAGKRTRATLTGYLLFSGRGLGN
ncbi:type II secretion system minor pseudopilin GspI [Gammaproteobacteria bacterium]|nr:type II secretion system minor pseudopilin GspI [Gammaproteobacteria bacterium]